jgi:hypothetical protein
MDAVILPQFYDELTPEERREVRNAYVYQQGGKCYHCGCPLNGQPAKKVASAHIRWKAFPDTFRCWPIHLHHSHKTGLTIGAVHMRCNAWLWQYKGE